MLGVIACDAAPPGTANPGAPDAGAADGGGMASRSVAAPPAPDDPLTVVTEAGEVQRPQLGATRNPSRPGRGSRYRRRVTRAWWAVLLAAGCADDAPAGAPTRARAVIVDAPGDHGAVIYRDGQRPWQLAPRLAAHRYGFDLEDTRYGVARLCAGDHAQHVRVVFATVDERRDLVLPGCDPAPSAPDATLRGRISGLAGHGYTVAAGPVALTSLTAGASEDYALTTSSGPQDVIAVRNQPFELDRFAIRRAFAVAEGHGLDLDLERDGAAARPLTVSASGDGVVFPTISVTFTTSTTTLALGELPNAAGEFAAPPAALWRSGDRLILEARNTVERGVTQRARRELADPNASSVALTLPPPLGATSFVATPQGYYATWADYPDADELEITITARGPTPGCADGCNPRWGITIAPGWLAPLPSAALLIAPGVDTLEELGVWDERLRLPDDAAWTVEAIRYGATERRSAARDGVLERTAP